MNRRLGTLGAAIHPLADNPEAVGNATPSWGVGLRSMRERAEMLGGDLRVDSSPGSSTRVEVKVPLDGRS